MAQLGLTRDSWTAPIAVRRVHPLENANATAVAAAPIRDAVGRLPAAGPGPGCVFDAGYDPLRLARALDGTPAAILVRLRRGRCFSAAPPPSPGAGRPRRHGRTFARDDPTRWPPPSDEATEDDAQYGAVRGRAGAGRHAKPGQSRARPRRAAKPVVAGPLILGEVGRLPGRTQRPQARWLWWHGPGPPDLALALAWRAYVRRCDLEHTFRFVKQALN